MQFRRSMLSPVMLLLLVGVAAATAQTAFADMVKVNPAAQVELMKAKARTSALRLTPDGDTTWVGHVYNPTNVVRPSANGLPAGYGPFHVGVGDYRPGTGDLYADNGYWDFDRFNPGEADSLQGWTPVTQPFQSVGGSNKIDRDREFFCFDFGNGGNYKGNSFGKKSYGVIGYWHVDNGGAPIAQNANVNPGVTPVGMTVITGSGSAWCGLRAHGDIRYTDPITGGVYNSSIIEVHGDNHQIQIGAGGAGYTDANYPGYGSQWDQMLYRDVNATAGAGLSISFDYDATMSTGVNTASNTRTGWFDKDPLRTTTLNDANFISSSDAGANAPIDSFMVYVGVPVNDAACAYTDDPGYIAGGGPFTAISPRPVYDPLRRWFSEVIAIDQPYTQVLSTFGDSPVTPFATVVPAGVIDPILTAGGGKVRVVFRVKTNKGFDDEDNGVSAYTSGGRGAVILDNVSLNAGAGVVVGNFEASGDIDNTVSASAAWRSTGKPPAVYMHVHNISPAFGLPYQDPCGSVSPPGANRLCNMLGNIITAGNHSGAEKPAGLFGANNQDIQQWFMSPTLNLKSTGVGAYNDMGIDAAIADATGEIYLSFDAYVNLFQFGSTGNGMRCGWSSFPAIQPNGVRAWGTVVKNIFFSAYDGFTGCANGDNGISPSGAFGKSEGLILTDNTNGIPDSLRAYIEHLAICFRRPVTAATCSPNSGPNAGAYWDNISIGLIDAAPPPGLAHSIWDVWQDAFPTNGSASFVLSPDFDTLAAQVRTGYNTGPQTGNANRCVVPGDTMYVTGAGDNVRVDLVFRILPGVGNFTTTGNHTSQMKRRPDQATGATAGDGSFWGSYMGDVGKFGFSGPNATAKTMSAATGVAANRWDANCWLSARLDTLERNLYANLAAGNSGAIEQLTPGTWMSMYHEAEVDPTYAFDLTGAAGDQQNPALDARGRRASLAITKGRCYIQNPALAIDETNIICGPAGFTGGGYSAGADRTCGGALCAAGTTGEFTKIIPDGQLTPGAHVEYFFRKTFVNNDVAFEMMPDSNLVYPQPVFGSDFDGIRYASMHVLPDRWKDGSFSLRPGSTMACMLVVNQGRRRGDLVIWDNMAGAIGLTPVSRRGAGGHGHWVPATADLPANVTEVVTSGGQVVRANLGQEGGLYDVYNVTAGESNVPAGRLGSREGANCVGLMTGKTSTAGPTRAMLRSYYRHVVNLVTDLDQQVYGPITDQSDNDIGLFTDFLTNATGTATPRTMIFIGRDIAKGLNDAANGFPTFFPTFFGATFRNDDYRIFSTNTNDIPDLIPVAPLSTTGAIYGVASPCFYKNDVLNLNTGLTGAAAAVFYENVGVGGPFIAGVYTPAVSGRIANTFLGAWTFGTFGQQGSRFSLSRGGHHIFWLNALVGLGSTAGCAALGTPVGIGDLPTSGKSFVNYMALRSENPMRSGMAKISFGLVKTEKVEVTVYDVTGRKVKSLANQSFTGGQEHTIFWNGTNDEGQTVAGGVYFYQLRSPSFTSQKKLTVLRN